MHSFVKKKLKPNEEHISTKHATHLEVADLLAKGLPSVQIWDGVVQDSLHEPGGRGKTRVVPHCPPAAAGVAKCQCEKSGGQGQLSETRSWSSRAEDGRGRTLVTPARSLLGRPRAYTGPCVVSGALEPGCPFLTSRLTKQYCSSGLLSVFQLIFPFIMKKLHVGGGDSFGGRRGYPEEKAHWPGGGSPWPKGEGGSCCQGSACQGG